jgi:hypothetical protein
MPFCDDTTDQAGCLPIREGSFLQRLPRLTDSDDDRNLLMARVQHRQARPESGRTSRVAMMTEIEMSP